MSNQMHGGVDSVGSWITAKPVAVNLLRGWMSL